MKFGLVVLGIIFLVFGGVLHYYPSPIFSAQTDSGPAGEVSPVNSSATFTIPAEWSYALMIMGGLFLILGLLIPDASRAVQGPQGPRGTPGKTRRSQVRTVQTIRLPAKRKSRRRVPLPRGTSVTTTTTRTRR